MAATTAKSTKTSAQSSVSADDLEADLAKLRADIAQLKKDLAAAGEQSYRTAKRAAYDGADQLRAQGEATLADIKASAREIEDVLVYLQFQDRVSQIQQHVVSSAQEAAEAVDLCRQERGAGKPVEPLDVSRTLARIQASYSTTEERRNHGSLDAQVSASESGSELTFF